MREGEDDMVMGAIKQAGALRRKPALDLDLVTLRAGAVATGVVPHPFDMAFRAGLDVAAQRRSTAADELLCGFMIMQRESAPGSERGKVLTKDLLYGGGHP